MAVSDTSLFSSYSLEAGEFLCENRTWNPYYGVYGIPRILEIVFLCICILVGTFGNLLVICSIIYSKKAFKSGNIFIINLAIADLIVCSFFMPTVLVTVVKTENVLTDLVCYFAGYLVTATCACSVCNLAFIAFCRYWAIVRDKSYERVFSRRNVIFMIIFTWFWSNLIVSPTLFGWSRLIYDTKMAECGWDDCTSVAYNVLLMTFAIFVPVLVILICYWRLYVSVIRQGKLMRQISSQLPEVVTCLHRQVQMKREISLLKTLAVTIVTFLLCWTPYGITITFFVRHVPPEAKKAAARLGLSNSAMNFIVYGVMNSAYREGYKNFLARIFCCKKICRRGKFTIGNQQTNVNNDGGANV